MFQFVPSGRHEGAIDYYLKYADQALILHIRWPLAGDRDSRIRFWFSGNAGTTADGLTQFAEHCLQLLVSTDVSLTRQT